MVEEKVGILNGFIQGIRDEVRLVKFPNAYPNNLSKYGSSYHVGAMIGELVGPFCHPICSVKEVTEDIRDSMNSRRRELSNRTSE